jgi:hypothetical protein
MRRILLLLISLCILLPSGYSKPRTYSKALDVANAFYKKASGFITAQSVTTSNLKLAYTASKEDVLTRSTENAYFYVFNAGNSNGFVIISGDDSAADILGYSSTGSFSMDSIPANFRNWLENYKKELQFLMDNPSSSNSNLLSATSNLTANSISPLLGNIKWNQGLPYNILCPKSGTRSTYTGCVATAIAQIMMYYQYPVKGSGTKIYTPETLNTPLTVDFSATTYDWNNMLSTYSGSESDIQKNAVATLMYHCGVAANMDYGTSSSAAYDEDAAIGLIKYFNYDSNLRTIYRDYYSADEWVEILRNELNSGRPVLYGGAKNTNSGHAFICDGYDANNLYHFNWGWNGYCDGYYALTSLKPNSTGTDAGSTEGGYTIAQDMTIGIQKPTSDSKPSYQLLLNDETAMTFTIGQATAGSTFSITVPFFNGGITKFNGKTAVGLCQDSNLISILGETSDISLAGFNYGTFEDKTINYSDLSIPVNITNGTYQLYSIYKGNDETSWHKMRAMVSQVSFLNIQVVDGNVTIKNESTGINSTKNNQLRVYPTLVKDVIYINSEEIIKSIHIFDLTGKEVLLMNPESSGEITVSLNELCSGIYILQCKTATDIRISKFIKGK